MAITASLVKELRERTGSGMMDCKKALVETSGDLEAAIDLMRASGGAKAAKKSTRIAADGVVRVALSDNKQRAILLEVNSETDFVTKSNDFINFVNELVSLSIDNSIDDVDALMALNTTSGASVANARETLVAKIGENIAVRRLFVATINTGTFGVYQHGNRIATVSVLDSNNEVLAKDIAMHVAASNPECIKEADVPKALLAREKAIFIEQAQESGKPDNIIEKMIVGKMRKFVAGITLYGQSFIKDPEITVAQLVKNNQTQVLSFMRYEVGEGIQKKEVDFRAEVMTQAQG